MNLFTIVIKSIKYYWKQNLALLIGTVISTAVLTGALIIGDSVRSSLVHLVDLRLGNAELALVTGDRFVRSELANEMSEKLQVKTAPLLFSEGITINTNNQSRINKSNIIGINADFWKLSDKEIIQLNPDEVIINSAIAERLSLKVEDEILIRLEKPSIIPLNAPFVSEENQTQSFRLKIKAIIDKDNLGRFSLKSNQSEPFNVFVSKEFLADELELNGLCNIILSEKKSLSKKDFDNFLDKNWNLKDLSLHVKEIPESNEIEIISDRIFIDDAVTKEVDKLNIPINKNLTYLINSIDANGNATPYSFASAIENIDLNENEVLINQWLADDLSAKPGDSLSLSYFIVGPLRKLKEETRFFIIKDIIPTEGEISNNSLMPEFPGLADAGSCSEWETGVPIDLKKIRDKDEKYWDDYKGTPKAYITYKKGKEIWNNNFGTTTSLRFNKNDISANELQNDLKEVLSPQLAGLQFVAVKEKGIAAAKNMVDFGELFLSLSFFIIAAGVLLTFLIYSFNTQARSKESGILAGIGFNKKLILKVRLWESIIVIVIGGVLGIFAGILYNYGILAGINTIWQDVVRTNMIDVYIFPSTLFIGFTSGAIISIITVYIVTSRTLKNSISNLVQSYFSQSFIKVKNNKISLIIGLLSIIILIFVIAFSFASANLNTSIYLSSGAIFIIGAIALANHFLLIKKENTEDISLMKLAFRNAQRNKSRSLATIILLAIGTFSVIITGSNRKTFIGTDNNKNAGTGGFQYWTELTVPILKDLNSEAGKEEYGLTDEPIFDHTQFIQMHLFDGDDASCLNLNQVQNPKILGIDVEYFQQRKAFSFDKVLKDLDSNNLWIELNKTYAKNSIPAIADQTVIQWGLLKKVGDTLHYTNENGEDLKLVLIAGLGASIFQGNILIAEKHFIENFPSISGSKVMLIETGDKQSSQLEKDLQFYFQDYGIEINKTGERLKEFYSITNSYLSIFLALGALGVIIGTIGLGIVLLRNIMDRRSELALLLASGYKKKEILKLILVENIVLLFSGLFIGIIAAFIGILPTIFSQSYNMPGEFIIVIIALIIISGIFWIYVPSRIALQKNIVQSLREE